MKPKKIAVIVISLAKGGAERGTAMISKICENLGHEVVLISILDIIDFEYGGKYKTLHNKKDSTYLKPFLKFSRIKTIFKEENFDLIIDGRSRPTFFKELIFKHMVYKNIPCISMIHNSFLPRSFPSSKFLAKFIYKTDTLIVVSKKINEIVKQTYNFKKVYTITYGVSKKQLKQLSDKSIKIPFEKYILYYGRFENQSKNLTFLIKSYSLSKLSKLKIPLILLGKGPDETVLKEQVSTLKLKDSIHFLPYTPNPMPYIKHSLYTVMTSNFEGFPMTLLESLTLSTPVVTLDYVSGPSEIIETGKNGILVTNKNESTFADALNKMVVNPVFYQKCIDGALESASLYDHKNITRKWEKIINNI